MLAKAGEPTEVHPVLPPASVLRTRGLILPTSTASAGPPWDLSEKFAEGISTWNPGPILKLLKTASESNTGASLPLSERLALHLGT